MLHSKIAFVFSFKNLNTSPGVLNNLGLFCKITCQLDCQNAEYLRVQNISPFFCDLGTDDEQYQCFML